jgi:hypothetical protein
MKKQTLITVFCVLFLAASAVSAKTYFSHPTKGMMGNPGTRAKPWASLEEIAKTKKLNRLKGGDSLLLYSGYHGHVSFGGHKKDVVTIAPVEGQAPKLGRLIITKGSKWTVRGLAISPSYGKEPYKGNIVTFAEGGPSSEIVIEDCFIHTAEDTSKWTAKEWMNANSGIFMGRHGKKLTLRNNYVLNTRFGIALCAYDSLCEGNVVSDFSGDGIRVTRDGITVQYNVIKNIYVGSKDGDKNHDDAIQCFLFNKGTGIVRNVTVKYNVILNQEKDDQPFATTLQAIGFFDGPLIKFKVENNVVAVKHWHGVSLYDAQHCVIQNNVVFNPWGGRFTPWVQLGSKQGKAFGNTVKNNYAHTFRLEADKTVKKENNRTITKKIYEANRKKLLSMIEEKFGKHHPVAGYGRTGKQKVKSNK